MNTKLILFEKILNIFAFFSILTFSIFLDSPSIFVLYLLIVLLLFLAFYKSNVIRPVKYFNFYIFSSIVIVLSFYFENGSFFIDGEDDEGYYIRTMRMLNNEFDPEFIYYNFKGFLYINYYVYKFLDLIGFSENSFFVINILNCFAGVGVLIMLAKIIHKLKLSSEVDNSLWFFSFFPNFLLITTTGIRDVWVILTMVAYFYVLLFSTRTAFEKSILKILLLLVGFFFRPVNLFYLLSIEFVTLFKKLVEKKGYLTSIILAFSSAAALGLVFFTQVSDIIKIYIPAALATYNELERISYSSSSLGLALRSAPFPLNTLWFPYVLINPFPPPAIYKFSFYNLLLSIGSLTWIASLPFIIINLTTTRKKYLFLDIVIVLSVLVLIATSFTSGHFRHISILYPFAFIVLLQRNKNFKIVELFYSLSALLFTAFFFIYLILKFF